MDHFALWFGLAAAAVVVPLVGFFLRAGMRGGIWLEALKYAAQKYELKFSDPGRGRSWPITAYAGGGYQHRGIEIGTDMDIKGRTDWKPASVMEIKVSGHFDRSLTIVKRGHLRTWMDPDVIDYSKRTSSPRETPSGDKAFDERVEMYHASEALRGALKDGGLSNVIAQLVDDGLRVEKQRLVLRTRRFPKRREDIAARVDRMLELCDELEKLQEEK